MKNNLLKAFLYTIIIFSIVAALCIGFAYIFEIYGSTVGFISIIGTLVFVGIFATIYTWLDER